MMPAVVFLTKMYRHGVTHVSTWRSPASSPHQGGSGYVAGRLVAAHAWSRLVTPRASIGADDANAPGGACRA